MNWAWLNPKESEDVKIEAGIRSPVAVSEGCPGVQILQSIGQAEGWGWQVAVGRQGEESGQRQSLHSLEI